MKLLFQYDFYENNLQYVNYKTTDDNIYFFKEIINKIHEIDNIIKQNLYNYKLERLNKIDKAIIRLATFELLEKKIIPKIIINEAIELTKKYSDLDDQKQHKFNNKILDNIYKNLKNNH